MDFGDLKNDAQIKAKISNVNGSIDKIKELLNVAYNKDIYEKLDTMDKVNYDLFLSYTLNTLYWMYLRTKGIDPNKHEIKNELNRIKEYMIKSKQAHERNTIRPKLDKEASKRFIRNGLWGADKPQPPANKRIKFT